MRREDAVNESDDLEAGFLRRSFAAVDGLWFMEVEQQLGFERALGIDRDVWRVMPKIQARWLKAALGQSKGLRALHTCLAARLRWEGYTFEAHWSGEGRALEIAIQDCPWRRLLSRAGREHLAPRIGPLICGEEYATWAAEFGEGVSFALGAVACRGAACCVLCFAETGDEGGVAGEDKP